MYAVVIDDSAKEAVGGRLRVCGSGGQSQRTAVYTSASSTLKIVLHRVVSADDDNDDDVNGYNFLLKYEGQSTSTNDAVLHSVLVFQLSDRGPKYLYTYFWKHVKLQKKTRWAQETLRRWNCWLDCNDVATLYDNGKEREKLENGVSVRDL